MSVQVPSSSYVFESDLVSTLDAGVQSGGSMPVGFFQHPETIPVSEFSMGSHNLLSGTRSVSHVLAVEEMLGVTIFNPEGTSVSHWIAVELFVKVVIVAGCLANGQG